MQAEVDEAIHKAVWAREDLSKEPFTQAMKAVSYTGSYENWKLLVVRFEMSEGPGYDGTATLASAGLVVRLVRGQAKTAFNIASNGDKT